MTPFQAYENCIKHGRNAELEKIIILEPYYAFRYAQDVIKGRWIEAEKNISNRSADAYLYAANIIKGKLPELMHNMMLLHAIHTDDCNEFWAKQYLNFLDFINDSSSV